MKLGIEGKRALVMGGSSGSKVNSLRNVLPLLASLVFYPILSHGEQPQANSCKYLEPGAAEIFCKGYAKLKKTPLPDHFRAGQIAESRMWKAALSFCAGVGGNHELALQVRHAPSKYKDEITILGEFLCLSSPDIASP